MSSTPVTPTITTIPAITPTAARTGRFARLPLVGATAAMALSLMACSNMSPAVRDTTIGATAGAVVGGVVTGSTTGAAVGAAVGGVIGNEVNKRK